MKPKIEETAAQKRERLRAERENVSTMQEYLQQQTRHYQKMKSPRVSIATGRSFAAVPLS